MFPLIMMEYLLLVFALYLYQQTLGREEKENKYDKYSLELQSVRQGVSWPRHVVRREGGWR